MSRTVLFQAIQFCQTVLIQTIQFSIRTDLVSLFNGMSTLIGYLMPKQLFYMNNSDTI